VINWRDCPVKNEFTSAENVWTEATCFTRDEKVEMCSSNQKKNHNRKAKLQWRHKTILGELNLQFLKYLMTQVTISYCCAKFLHITNMTCREMCKIKREIFQTVDNIKAQQSKPTKLNKI